MDYASETSSSNGAVTNEFKKASDLLSSQVESSTQIVSKKKRVSLKDKFSIRKNLMNQKSVSEYFKPKSSKSSSGDDTPENKEAHNSDSDATIIDEPTNFDVDNFSSEELELQKKLLNMFNNKNAENEIVNNEVEESHDDITPENNLKRKLENDEINENVTKKPKESPEKIKSKIMDLFGDDEAFVSDVVTNHHKIDRPEKKRPSSTQHKNVNIKRDEKKINHKIENNKEITHKKEEKLFKEKISSKEKVRVSDLVIKHLMPTYKQRKIITSKEQFKHVAREMSKQLLERKGSNTSKY